MKAALLLVDVQQDFLRRPGLVPDAQVLTQRLADLLAVCRAEGLPVLHSRMQIDADGRGAMPHWIRSGLRECVAGTEGARAPSGLEALADEPVFIKPFFSAFGHPTLESDLKQRAVDTLIVAGVHAHACIRATVLDAYQRGFTVWVVADAVASDSPLHASLSLGHLDGRACEVISAAQTAHRLGWTRPAAAAPSSDVRPLAWFGSRWLPAKGHDTWLQRDPCDGRRVLASVPLARSADVEHAAAPLVGGQRAWARRDIAERAALLARWADGLLERTEALVDLLAREIGKPSTDGRAEVRYAIDLLHACVRRPRTEAAPMGPGQTVRVRSRPIGVVGLITPWNNPLAIPVGKIAPALLWGNAVLWKPALQAPRLAELLIDSLQAAGLPADCTSLVFGDAVTAHEVVARPEVAAVSFTGSTAAGRQVAIACASGGKRLQAELGGNNAVLVSASADVAAVATRLAAMAFSFSGQRCTAPRRMIVARSVLDGFTQTLASAAARLHIGEPLDALTQIGPLISREQRARVADGVSTGLREGATLVCGGRVPAGFDHGGWYEPTILRADDASLAVVNQETFGPVVVVMAADTFQHAMTLCNGVEQGLVASLYSADPDELQLFRQTAQAGILRINDMEGRIHPDAPFGGCKASGFGPPEHGRWDQEFYTLSQAVYG